MKKTPFLIIGMVTIAAILGNLLFVVFQGPVAEAKPVEPTESIRQFIGDPEAVVVFEERMVNVAGEPFETYRVNKDRFIVDPETGMVTGAQFVEAQRKIQGPLSVEQAKNSAKIFAQIHYNNFNSRNMVLTESQAIDHGDAGTEYSYTWNEQDQSINTGNLVHVSLNTDGSVRSYHARYKTVPRMEPARISKSQAIDTATRYVIETTKVSNISSNETSALLTAMPDGSNRVVWIVSVILRYMDLRLGIEDHRGGSVYIDAMNGEIVKFDPCL
jgi:hypothetical protein